jgi:hypothetical protein
MTSTSSDACPPPVASAPMGERIRRAWQDEVLLLPLGDAGRARRLPGQPKHSRLSGLGGAAQVELLGTGETFAAWRLPRGRRGGPAGADPLARARPPAGRRARGARRSSLPGVGPEPLALHDDAGGQPAGRSRTWSRPRCRAGSSRSVGLDQAPPARPRRAPRAAPPRHHARPRADRTRRRSLEADEPGAPLAARPVRGRHAARRSRRARPGGRTSRAAGRRAGAAERRSRLRRPRGVRAQSWRPVRDEHRVGGGARRDDPLVGSADIPVGSAAATVRSTPPPVGSAPPPVDSAPSPLHRLRVGDGRRPGARPRDHRRAGARRPLVRAAHRRRRRRVREPVPARARSARRHSRPPPPRGPGTAAACADASTLRVCAHAGPRGRSTRRRRCCCTSRGGSPVAAQTPEAGGDPGADASVGREPRRGLAERFSSAHMRGATGSLDERGRTELYRAALTPLRSTLSALLSVD